MKLVIDIPEEDYIRLRDEGMFGNVTTFKRAVREGTPIEDMGELCDGYHTFNQLYHQRAVLFATIVNQNKDRSWKSFKHSDGNYCFDSNGEWFVVGIDTPQGSYTYHYAKEYWDMFDCEELECGKEWDGHTEEDVTRLLSLQQEPCTDAKKYFSTIYELSQTCGLSYSFIDEKIKEIIPALKKPSISEDGTLTVNVEDGNKVSRVLVCGDNHFGGLYYPEQEPCEMTAEEYRQRMIQAFHNADTDELIAVCVLPTEKEFEHLEWLLKNHYKQEPCDDAISRQAVLDMLEDINAETEGVGFYYKHYVEYIKKLPPVKPAEKVGYWIIYDVHGHKACKCSECNNDVGYPCTDKYCKYCGAKMQEVEGNG